MRTLISLQAGQWNCRGKCVPEWSLGTRELVLVRPLPGSGLSGEDNPVVLLAELLDHRLQILASLRLAPKGIPAV